MRGLLVLALPALLAAGCFLPPAPPEPPAPPALGVTRTAFGNGSCPTVDGERRCRIATSFTVTSLSDVPTPVAPPAVEVTGPGARVDPSLPDYVRGCEEPLAPAGEPGDSCSMTYIVSAVSGGQVTATFTAGTHVGSVTFTAFTFPI